MKVVFELNEEQWDELQRLLNEPVLEIPRLRELLNSPTVFDESDK